MLALVNQLRLVDQERHLPHPCELILIDVLQLVVVALRPIIGPLHGCVSQEGGAGQISALGILVECSRSGGREDVERLADLGQEPETNHVRIIRHFTIEELMKC